jgi:hypothetical protein
VGSDYVATFILVVDSTVTFETVPVPQLVKKFPEIYETDGSFPSSQKPGT